MVKKKKKMLSCIKSLNSLKKLKEVLKSYL